MDPNTSKYRFIQSKVVYNELSCNDKINTIAGIFYQHCKGESGGNTILDVKQFVVPTILNPFQLAQSKKNMKTISTFINRYQIQINNEVLKLKSIDQATDIGKQNLLPTDELDVKCYVSGEVVDENNHENIIAEPANIQISDEHEDIQFSDSPPVYSSNKHESAQYSSPADVCDDWSVDDSNSECSGTTSDNQLDVNIVKEEGEPLINPRSNVMLNHKVGNLKAAGSVTVAFDYKTEEDTSCIKNKRKFDKCQNLIGSFDIDHCDWVAITDDKRQILNLSIH